MSREATASRAFPIDFSTAFDLGTLDRMVSQSPGSYFPAKQTMGKLRYGDKYYGRRFFKFSLASDVADFPFEMQEDPATSLYVNVYNFNRQLRATERGDDHEKFTHKLTRGTYYVEILPGEGRSRPDGTNEFKASFMAHPALDNPDAGPHTETAMDLGQLRVGSHIQFKQRLLRVYDRGRITGKGLRAPGNNKLVDDCYDVLRFVLPQDALVSVSIYGTFARAIGFIHPYVGPGHSLSRVTRLRKETAL